MVEQWNSEGKIVLEELWNSDGGTVERCWWKSENVLVEQWNSVVQQWNSDGGIAGGTVEKCSRTVKQ